MIFTCWCFAHLKQTPKSHQRAAPRENEPKEKRDAERMCLIAASASYGLVGSVKQLVHCVLCAFLSVAAIEVQERGGNACTDIL